MNENIGDRIKLAMKKKKVKQVDVVTNTGITKGALSSYLSNRYSPKQTAIYKISKYLNVNPAWLMGYDVPMEYEYQNNSPLINKINTLSDEDKKFIEKMIDNLKGNNEK